MMYPEFKALNSKTTAVINKNHNVAWHPEPRILLNLNKKDMSHIIQNNQKTILIQFNELSKSQRFLTNSSIQFFATVPYTIFLLYDITD